MNLLVLLIVIFLTSCQSESSPEKQEVYPTYTKDLEDSIKTLNLQYIAWACECANWATPDDIDRYTDTGKLSEHSIFIEPYDSTLELSDTLGYSADLIRFTGRFYKDQGYPKNYLKGEQRVEKARVFRYTNYKVIRSNYRDLMKNTTPGTK